MSKILQVVTACAGLALFPVASQAVPTVGDYDWLFSGTADSGNVHGSGMFTLNQDGSVDDFMATIGLDILSAQIRLPVELLFVEGSLTGDGEGLLTGEITSTFHLPELCVCVIPDLLGGCIEEVCTPEIDSIEVLTFDGSDTATGRGTLFSTVSGTYTSTLKPGGDAPEPSTLLLFGAGLVALARRQRR